MRLSAAILFVSISLVSFPKSYGQFSYQTARSLFNRSDSLSPFETVASGKTVDVLKDSTQRIEELLEAIILKDFKGFKKTELHRSAILTGLSQLACSSWAGTTLTNPKKIASVRKKIQRTFNVSNCSFGLIKLYAFSIPLVETPEDFYYKADGHAGGYNLYNGKRYSKKVDDSGEEILPVPLHTYSEAELVDLIEKKLRKSKCSADMHSKVMSTVGYCIVPDRRTLLKRKTPSVKVVIIAGAKRMQLVKVKKQSEG